MEVEIYHILVKHEYEIDDLLRKLKEGSQFEDLARKFSVCPSAKEGGYLGLIQRGRTVSEFEQAAFELKKGETSKAVRTAFGYHLIYRAN